MIDRSAFSRLSISPFSTSNRSSRIRVATPSIIEERFSGATSVRFSGAGGGTAELRL